MALSSESEYRRAAPMASRAFFVILAYTAVLVGAALWIFQRRDIAAAKGE